MKISNIPIVALLLMCAFAPDRGIAEQYDGRAVLGRIKAKDYVVTQEVDRAFGTWQNDPIRIPAGYGAYADYKAVAIGNPMVITNRYQEITPDFTKEWPLGGWNPNFLGPTESLDRSVAVGNSAKALEQVSVAIGNQAIVGRLHKAQNILHVYTNRTMEVTSRDGNVTTNYDVPGIVYQVDMSRLERLAQDAGSWRLIRTETPEPGVTKTTYERNTYSLKDISCLDDWEYDMYNQIVQSGQGPVNFLNSIYGVAIGSRAYVFGYHGLALGHYAHVSRPFGTAIGSESHVYSEGSQAFGFDTDIPEGSPYCLAIGVNASVDPGMTNAIVIGMPKMGVRLTTGVMQDRPRAMKSNSINLVCNGNGISDFYIDNIPLQTRLGYETKVIGNTKPSTTMQSVQDTLGLKGDDDIVVAAGDGKVRVFTKSYIERGADMDGIADEDPHLEEIVINGKTLKEILGDMGHNNKVRKAAEDARALMDRASNIVEVKSVLNGFFDAIKQ